MARQAYQYAIEGSSADEVPEFDLLDIHPLEAKDLSWLAEKAAENFYYHLGGWEMEWPLTFILFDIEGKELGRFQVEMEPRPVFTATKRIEDRKAERDQRRLLQPSRPLLDC